MADFFRHKNQLDVKKCMLVVISEEKYDINLLCTKV